MPGFFFLYGLRLNTEANIKCMEEGVAARRYYVWQHVSAQSHKQENPVLAVTNFLRPHHPIVWLLNSPACNSLDYYLMGVVEWDPNKTPYNSKDELKAKIMAVFTNLIKDDVRKAGRIFRSHLAAVTRTRGELV